MNILIITPLNPIDVMDVYLECTLHMDIQTQLFFSIPAMALLGEETMQDSNISYEKILTMFLKSFYKTSIAKDMQTNNTNIFIGTLPKNVVKPDYIIGIIPPYKELDDYIDDIAQKINQITPIYTIQDADLTFPTYHHLEKFLQTFSLPKKGKEEKGDISELQSEATDSSRQ